MSYALQVERLDAFSLAWFQGALARGVAGKDLPDLNQVRVDFDDALTSSGIRVDIDPQEAALRRALGV